MTTHSMPATTAVALLTALDEAGADVCVGGGWSIDASIGEQTRPHGDLDLWVPAERTPQLFAVLIGRGIERLHFWPDNRPWNFVLHDGRTTRIDLHFYERDGGRVRYGPRHDPFLFALSDLDGRGRIGEVDVRCEQPSFALRCHTGYPPRDVDRADVAALCDRFDLVLPDAYRQAPEIDPA